MRNRINAKSITKIAVIAAIYAGLTLAVAPLSYAVMQIRISEAMTILPVFTPLAIPGLFIGCLLANLMSPVGFADVVVGSIATLIGAAGTYVLRKHRFLAMCCPVISNGILVGAMLHYVAGENLPLYLCIIWVSIGEAAACFIIGLALGKLLDRHRSIFD